MFNIQFKYEQGGGLIAKYTFERNQIENMIIFKGYIYHLSFFDIVLTS
jgi:hypothetical protein